MGALWNRSGLTDDEALAAMEAISKAMKPNLDMAKMEARQALLEQAEEGKADRRPILIDGQKVGEVGVSYAKPSIEIAPGYEDNALKALRELGLTKEVPVSGWQSHFTRVGDAIANIETGEIASWAQFVPGGAKSAAVRGCKPEDVFPAMQAKLGDGGLNRLLLGGSNE